MSLRDRVLRTAHGALTAKSAVRPPRDHAMIIMLHTLSRDLDTALHGPLDPFQPFTPQHLAELIAAVQALGYRFTTTNELRTAGRGEALALLTFDDGYSNNLRALPVLEGANVPAVIFAATAAIETGRAFWWDALHRGAREAGMPATEAAALGEHLKTRPWQEIEATVAARFGDAVFTPEGDEDRPMTVAELQNVAAHPLIEIGNHTHDHAILSVQDETEASAQIARGQDELTAWLGTPPRVIAYPNGGANQTVLAAAERIGLDMGVMVEPGLEALPLAGNAHRMMSLRRFMPVATRSISAQVARFALSKPATSPAV